MVSVTYQQVYEEIKKQLDSSFEAAQLFGYVTGVSREELLLHQNKVFPPSQRRQLQKLVQRRQEGEPLQYLLGEWEFYSLPFTVGEGVLIPRGDTEIVVDTVLELVKDRDHPEILDVCSGSGAIAIAVEKHMTATVTALELSPQAFEYLQKNVERNHSDVHPVQGDLYQYHHPKPLDLLVSNPPYIPQEEMKHLQREVQWEPSLALAGGEDGLDFYRGITEKFKESIRLGGWLVYEIGIYQEQAVERILKTHGFTEIGIKKDLGGIPRCIYGKRGGNQ